MEMNRNVASLQRKEGIRDLCMNLSIAYLSDVCCKLIAKIILRLYLDSLYLLVSVLRVAENLLFDSCLGILTSYSYSLKKKKSCQ